MNKELTIRQVCLFFIAFLPATKVILLPSVLANFANQDLYFSVIISSLIDIFTVISILYVYKKHGKSFFELLETRFGKVFKNIILALYFFYFLIKAYALLSEQKNYVNLTLYETVPTIFSFTPFFVVACLLCITKVKTIGRLSDMFFSITILSLLLVFALSFSNLDFGAILPVGINGITNVLKGSYYALNWFGDGVYLLFFLGSFKLKRKDGLKITLSYAGACFLILIFSFSFYLAFSSIAHKTFFALTDISKYSTVINNVGRVDYIAIFGILLINVISISLPLFFQTQIVMEIFNLKKRIIPAIIICLIHLLLMTFLNDLSVTVQNFIHDNLGWVFLFFSNLFPILLIFLRRKNEEL